MSYNPFGDGESDDDDSIQEDKGGSSNPFDSLPSTAPPSSSVANSPSPPVAASLAAVRICFSSYLLLFILACYSHVENSKSNNPFDLPPSRGLPTSALPSSASRIVTAPSRSTSLHPKKAREVVSTNPFDVCSQRDLSCSYHQIPEIHSPSSSAVSSRPSTHRGMARSSTPRSSSKDIDKAPKSARGSSQHSSAHKTSSSSSVRPDSSKKVSPFRRYSDVHTPLIP